MIIKKKKSECRKSTHRHSSRWARLQRGKKWKVKRDTQWEIWDNGGRDGRSQSAPDTRDARQGRQRGRKTERGRQESGLPQWVTAAWNSHPDASPSSTCLNPPSLLLASRRRYIFSPPPKKQCRGKVGRDCLGELIRRSQMCESKLLAIREARQRRHEWVTQGGRQRKNREGTFVLHLWSGRTWATGGVGAGVWHTYCTLYLPFSVCPCLNGTTRCVLFFFC